MIHPDILASIKFYSASQGGITQPIRTKLGFFFGYEDEFFDCKLLIEEGDIINPGDTKDILIAFLFPEYIKPKLKPGSRFVLKDYRYIAEGIVNKIY